MKTFGRLCTFLRWFTVAVVIIAPLRLSATEHVITDIFLSDEPLLTEDRDDGVKGLFADFFASASQEADRRVRIHRLPWKRAQQRVSGGKGFGIGPITRTQPREDKYAWIAPLFPMRIIYMTLDDGRSVVDGIEPARKLRVGVKRGSTGTFMAKKHGLPKENIIVANSQDILLKMLILGRIDAWLVWDVIAYRVLKGHGSAVRIAEGYTENLGDLYFAASPGTPAAEVDRWRAAVDLVIMRGGLDSVMDLYLDRQLRASRD